MATNGAFSSHDRQVLRRLAERQAKVAALPVHRRTISEWKRLNGNRPGKPMVWISQVCWNQFADPELELQCEDRLARKTEEGMRRTLYQWQHMPADMVVEDMVWCPLAIRYEGGLREDVDVVAADQGNDVVSRHFHVQIQEEKDLEKITAPTVIHDEAESARTFDMLNGAIGDILPVKQRGVANFWFAPWDELVRYYGPQEALLDMAMRPEMIHGAMERMLQASLSVLEQWQKLNLLSLNNGNVWAGSGGLAYTDELPSAGFDPQHVRPIDQWANSTSQIFSEVSPAMHEEFALQYERRWLERFGLSYYGCCEPLHLKIGILKSIGNLRKVSMSPWADLARGVEDIGGRYVISHKPNPAVLAMERWDLQLAERNLRDALDKTRGCAVEIIMKDISSVRQEPQRLFDWARMASEVAAQYA